MPRDQDKHAIDDARWQVAVAREAVIQPLINAGQLSPVDVATACRILGLRRSRLYALIEQYRNTPVTSSLAAARPGPKKGARRLAVEVEAAIEEAIRDKYLTRQKASVSTLHDHIRHLCRERGLDIPSWKAVRARVEQIDRFKLVRQREGNKAARDRLRPVPEEYRADHALQIVQIDHTRVDLFVVDTIYRLPIQRPWLTLAIDVASRIVVGFYLSLEAPSSASVALAIHHAVMPKAEWLLARGIELDWPVSGLPDIIHVDNAREFRARALARGAAEYGISLVHRPVATPHYGGHIERLIGTMMGAVHMLPGTTFSSTAERGDYDPERHAVMTIEELERWLTLEIVGRYHNEVHSSLHMPPNAAWREALDRRRAPFRHPHDDQQFFYDFLPFEERSIRRDGVHIFGLRYWDDVLSPWAGRLDRQLRVKYDPRDLSCVFVEGPDGAHWPIRYADLRRPRITLGEHRLAQAALRQRGVRLTDEQLIFDTVEAQRELLETSASITKSARRQVARRTRSLSAADQGAAAEGVTPGPKEEPETLSVLAVEEWS
ncbi:putative transposase [Parvibaculum indicum]|uniref:Mu transposase C-terminal domain-containing protein n=1 Tax=Hyphomicrobiales TaxID=356 RepID=UPI0006B9C01A|nr:Mu transposase C-terminal domain-containing protein [Rhodopseudomonas sp. AAP120]KPF90461.1 transposase [Rhodopseudomonas sp. AAP120]NIJ42815.1 putative transposase [Parvibaculum indicum]